MSVKDVYFQSSLYHNNFYQDYGKLVCRSLLKCANAKNTIRSCSSFQAMFFFLTTRLEHIKLCGRIKTSTKRNSTFDVMTDILEYSHYCEILSSVRKAIHTKGENVNLIMTINTSLFYILFSDSVCLKYNQATA